MELNVRERGDHVATFRWIEVRLMEMLAAWVPTTPEMEVKLVLGAHIWEVAQHADAFGKRAHELRLALHDSLQPSGEYVQLITDLAATTDTSKRIAGFYDAILPGLERRFRAYLNQVDTLLDGPTVRIIERAIGDIARMTGESRALLEEVPAVKLKDKKWLDDLRNREANLREIVVYRRRGPTAVTAA